MMRFFAMANDPLNGSYLHLVFTSHKPTAQKCLEELEFRFNAGVLSMKPLFFDRGTGDSDLHSIEKVYGFKLVEEVAA